MKEGQLGTDKGVSFLEVKFRIPLFFSLIDFCIDLLLNYCLNICFYLLLKADGKSVKDHPVIDQIVRVRAIMDKLKPLDQKLKYQVDKLLKLAILGEVAGKRLL